MKEMREKEEAAANIDIKKSWKWRPETQRERLSYPRGLNLRHFIGPAHG